MHNFRRRWPAVLLSNNSVLQFAKKALPYLKSHALRARRPWRVTMKRAFSTKQQLDTLRMSKLKTALLLESADLSDARRAAPSVARNVRPKLATNYLADAKTRIQGTLLQCK